jgi:hypothetical protein
MKIAHAPTIERRHATVAVTNGAERPAVHGCSERGVFGAFFYNRFVPIEGSGDVV